MTGKFSPAVPSRMGVPQVTDLRESRPIALTIAGFDPSSGAGITADLKVFSAHNVYGVASISAMTVQSTQGVESVEPVSGTLMRQTLDCLAEDFLFSGVKIGMLGAANVAREVAAFLKTEAGRAERRRIVLDPVLCSTSGTPLLNPEGVDVLRQELLGCVGWITPNHSELAILTGMDIRQNTDVPLAALKLRETARELGNPSLNVVVTGGDLDRPDDFFLDAASSASDAGSWFPGEHIETKATHGTGCAFSSALVCRLIAGDSPADAVRNAKSYVTQALRSAYPIGKGKGPVNHLFRLDALG